ncbi:hypothetical protein BDV3_004749 [Batrachochytrium dendrobatidis]|nr:Zn finger protein [Batrachochytrium dendrobatidis]KAK5671106.1 Zn finger protein [Batrachochytrium dendrobatidis]
MMGTETIPKSTLQPKTTSKTARKRNKNSTPTANADVVKQVVTTDMASTFETSEKRNMVLERLVKALRSQLQAAVDTHNVSLDAAVSCHSDKSNEMLAADTLHQLQLRSIVQQKQEAATNRLFDALADTIPVGHPQHQLLLFVRQSAMEHFELQQLISRLACSLSTTSTAADKELDQKENSVDQDSLQGLPLLDLALEIIAKHTRTSGSLCTDVASTDSLLPPLPTMNSIATAELPNTQPSTIPHSEDPNVGVYLATARKVTFDGNQLLLNKLRLLKKGHQMKLEAANAEATALNIAGKQSIGQLRLEKDQLLKCIHLADETTAGLTAQVQQLTDMQNEFVHATKEISPQQDSLESNKMYMSVLTRSKALEKQLETVTQQYAILQQQLEDNGVQLKQYATVLSEKEIDIRNHVARIQEYQRMLTSSEQMLSTQRAEMDEIKDTVERAISIGKQQDAALESKDSIIRKMESQVQYGFSHSLSLFYTRLLVTGPDIHSLNRDHWIEDKDAVECHDPTCTKKFGVFVRRHHCRKCGNIYCAEHVSKHMRLSIATLEYHPHGVETKICDMCAVDTQEQLELNSTDFESLLTATSTPSCE